MCFVMLSQRARWTDVDYFVVLLIKRAERKGTSNLRLIEVWSPGLQNDRPRCWCCWTTDHPAMMRSLVLSTSVDIIISGSTHQQVGSNYYKYTCGRDAELLLTMPSWTERKARTVQWDDGDSVVVNPSRNWLGMTTWSHPSHPKHCRIEEASYARTLVKVRKRKRI